MTDRGSRWPSNASFSRDLEPVEEAGPPSVAIERRCPSLVVAVVRLAERSMRNGNEPLGSQDRIEGAHELRIYVFDDAPTPGFSNSDNDCDEVSPL